MYDVVIDQPEARTQTMINRALETRDPDLLEAWLPGSYAVINGMSYEITDVVGTYGDILFAALGEDGNVISLKASEVWDELYDSLHM